jgi:hypothetical protein
MGKGKVPILNRSGIYQFLLVDFPSREWFDEAYRRNKPEERDKYWDILTRRSKGATLDESGYPYALTRERVRQIEAKFIRRVETKYWSDTISNLTQIEQMAISSKSLRSFLETEKQ